MFEERMDETERKKKEVVESVGSWKVEERKNGERRGRGGRRVRVWVSGKDDYRENCVWSGVHVHSHVRSARLRSSIHASLEHMAQGLPRCLRVDSTESTADP